MNVNTTFSMSPEYSSPSPGSRIANLEKQIRTIEKQIAAETKSNDDPKTKSQVTQQLQVEAQTTELQIQQIQESVQQSREKQPTMTPTSPAHPSDDTKSGILLDTLA